jgi:hypothetical protein
MVTPGKRRYANPIVLNTDDSTAGLRRVPFTIRTFEEGWLQELIRANPELLPVADIEPAFAPLVSIGREVATAVGSIDNMFLSPQGYLTIVETKLWRNPEARREVVGQIIDYAKDVSHWTFEILEDKVRAYNEEYLHRNVGVLDSLRQIEQIDEAEEQRVVDTISRNLRQGRFLLLIVGDGIRESVEEMTDFLQRTPLLFTLALVELQVYELGAEGSKPLLVLPQIVARTREIIRAVVRVEGKAIESVHVEVDTEIKEVKTEKQPGKRFTLTEQDFFDALSQSVNQKDMAFAHQIIDDMQSRGCRIDWKQSSFVVKLPDPGGSGQQLTLFIVTRKGEMYVGWLPQQLQSLNLPPDIALDFVKESVQLFRDIEIHGKYPDSWSRNVLLGELRQQYNEFASLVQKTIDKIREASRGMTE